MYGLGFKPVNIGLFVLKRRMKSSILTVRVYYEDTDEQGIVYHANYLKFFERGRVEAFRSAEIELRKLLSDYDTQFVVQSLEVKYLQPAYLDQLLYIVTEVESVGSASVRYHQKAYLGTKHGSLLCEAKVRLACIDSKYRVKKLPKILSGALNI